MGNSAFNQGQTGNATESASGVVQEATAIQVAAKTDIGDTGAKLFVPPSKLPSGGDIELIASQALTIGDPVGASWNKSGYAAKAMYNNYHVAVGTTGWLTSLFYGHVYPMMDTNKIVTVNNVSGTLVAQVVNIDPDTFSATVGPIKDIVTDAVITTTNSMYDVTICKLDINKFVLFFQTTSGGTTSIRYVVGTISGDVISLGTEAEFITCSSTNLYFLSEQMGTDYGVFTSSESGGVAGVTAFTVSGTVVTPGAKAVFGTYLASFGVAGHLLKIGTDKFVFVEEEAVGDDVYAVVGTISGTTVTIGTEQVISSVTGISSTTGRVISHIDDAFIVYAGRASAGRHNITVCTVSGTTITAGTTLEDVGYQDNYPMLRLISPTELHSMSSNGISVATLTKFSIDGTTITEIGKELWYPSPTVGAYYDVYSGAPTYVYADMGSYFVQLGFNTTTDEYEIFIDGMANGIIGFAQNTVAIGETVKVRVAGIDSNQIGLRPGATYFYERETGTRYLLGNAVPLDNSNLPEDTKVFRAITDTDITI